uniref:Uncharacterized protein n=1 Tax=Timema shepardi TaxID=629360 RepID=A0A7R9B3T2_TIMSH|nr:unnamed protein product [Timema shepardi]
MATHYRTVQEETHYEEPARHGTTRHGAAKTLVETLCKSQITGHSRPTDTFLEKYYSRAVTLLSVAVLSVNSGLLSIEIYMQSNTTVAGLAVHSWLLIVGFFLYIEVKERSGLRAGTQTTTDDIPDFDRNKVSLDIPGELFGSSVNLVTRGSKAVGDVIMNAAQRVQRLIEALKPTVGGKLGVTATRTRRQHVGPNYDASPDLNTVDTTR